MWVYDPLLDSLEALRELVNKPIHLLSGCRCWEHNLSIPGSSRRSQHLVENEHGTSRPCKAADIYISGTKPRQMFQQALLIPAFRSGGIGIYEGQGFIHVDVRGEKARWFVPQSGDKPLGVPRNYY